MRRTLDSCLQKSADTIPDVYKRQLLHNPFLWKERTINSIIVMIHGLDPRKHLFAMVGIDDCLLYTSNVKMQLHNKREKEGGSCKPLTF